MPKTRQGSCKCGHVTYHGVQAEALMFRCHCRDCQQLTGAGHADMVPLEAESFRIDDTCRTYEMTGGSGRPTYTRFCPVCGSQLTRQSDRMRHLVYVHAGSLNDPTCYAPTKSLFPDAAQPWDTAVIGTVPPRRAD